MDFKGYLRQAHTLPRQVVLRKAVGVIRRASGDWVRLTSDKVAGSYGSARQGFNPAARIPIAAADIAPDLEATLRTLGAQYLQHRFDLLGSGWTSPVYRYEAKGFLGRIYAAGGPAAPDKAGRGLEAIVNRSNLSRSRQIWRLIARRDYVPIDWQLDFRSGYRWSSQRPSMRLSIPVDRGADVKVPWELGRLQHLPQLALCAILANAQKPGFAPASHFVDEISAQLADFVATNPPRFGVNWMSSMDVAIRAANIALTVALLAGADIVLPAPIAEIVTGALNDHAQHVLEHLDYSESGRSNHYLANLGGVVWSSWLLTGPEADRWLSFAIAELLKEADTQFLTDGENYEGSTSYHRLSAEIIVFALAVIVSLDAVTLARAEQSTQPRRAWRAAFPKLPLPRYDKTQTGGGLISPAVAQKLIGAARFSSAVQGSDGTIVQIGDTDSGRFFKLHPTALPEDSGQSNKLFVENDLDHSGLIDATAALFGADPHGKMLDAVLVRRLAEASRALNAPAPRSSLADFGDIDALVARWRAVPEPSRRLRRISLGQTVPPESWARTAFPDFGLYVFRYQDLLISLRCCGAPPIAAPRGHRHDDNLGIEYRLNGHECRDPGSFIYSPSIKRRNQYRAASAHDVPRARGQQLARIGSVLFDIDEIAYARCVCWRPNGVAGEMISPQGAILRIVQITREELLVFDSVQPPAEIGEIDAALPVSKGYGRL